MSGSTDEDFAKEMEVPTVFLPRNRTAWAMRHVCVRASTKPTVFFVGNEVL